MCFLIHTLMGQNIIYHEYNIRHIYLYVDNCIEQKRKLYPRYNLSQCCHMKDTFLLISLSFIVIVQRKFIVICSMPIFFDVPYLKMNIKLWSVRHGVYVAGDIAQNENKQLI